MTDFTAAVIVEEIDERGGGCRVTKMAKLTRTIALPCVPDRHDQIEIGGSWFDVERRWFTQGSQAILIQLESVKIYGRGDRETEYDSVIKNLIHCGWALEDGAETIRQGGTL